MENRKQIYSAMRDWKRENCPPYSKLNKAELEALVQSLGIPIPAEEPAQARARAPAPKKKRIKPKFDKTPKIMIKPKRKKKDKVKMAVAEAVKLGKKTIADGPKMNNLNLLEGLQGGIMGNIPLDLAPQAPDIPDEPRADRPMGRFDAPVMTPLDLSPQAPDIPDEPRADRPMGRFDAPVIKEPMGIQVQQANQILLDERKDRAVDVYNNYGKRKQVEKRNKKEHFRVEQKGVGMLYVDKLGNVYQSFQDYEPDKPMTWVYKGRENLGYTRKEREQKIADNKKERVENRDLVWIDDLPELKDEPDMDLDMDIVGIEREADADVKKFVDALEGVDINNLTKENQMGGIRAPPPKKEKSKVKTLPPLEERYGYNTIFTANRGKIYDDRSKRPLFFIDTTPYSGKIDTFFAVPIEGEDEWFEVRDLTRKSGSAQAGKKRLGFINIRDLQVRKVPTRDKDAKAQKRVIDYNLTDYNPFVNPEFNISDSLGKKGYVIDNGQFFTYNNKNEFGLDRIVKDLGQGKLDLIAGKRKSKKEREERAKPMYTPEEEAEAFKQFAKGMMPKKEKAKPKPKPEPVKPKSKKQKGADMDIDEAVLKGQYNKTAKSSIVNILKALDAKRRVLVLKSVIDDNDTYDAIFEDAKTFEDYVEAMDEVEDDDTGQSFYEIFGEKIWTKARKNYTKL